MQVIKIAEATGPQLLQFFNENATKVPDGKIVKKWSDLTSARKRTATLVEKLASYITGGKEGVDFPPEGCIMFVEEGDEPEEKAETQDYSDMGNVGKLDAADGEEEATEDDGPSAFGAMGKTLNGMGGKPAAPPATRSDAGRASNSAGVAASWADPKVRAARLTRDGVEVTWEGNTEAFKSTGEAWRALRLPAGKHIRFRQGLKASRREVYEFGGVEYVFVMVEIEAE